MKVDTSRDIQTFVSIGLVMKKKIVFEQKVKKTHALYLTLQRKIRQNN